MITGRAVGLESKKSDNKINSQQRGIFRINAEIRRRICVTSNDAGDVSFVLPKEGNEKLQHRMHQCSAPEENVFSR